MARITGTVLNDILTGTARRDQVFGLDGDDELRGAGASDLLDGGLGRDSMFGGKGNDRILGGSHVVERPGDDDDLINGGSGQDWVIYSSLKEPVEVFLGEDVGVAVVHHPIADLQLQTDELIGIENAVSSPVGHSVLSGNSQDNILVGIGPRTNFLSSAGEDTYKIDGKGSAFFFFLQDPAGIELDLSKHRLIDGFGDVDTLKLAGTVLVNGTQFNDVMIGGSRRDWFRGSFGEDEFHGKRGSDVIDPGGGSDLVDGGGGNDWYIADQTPDSPLAVDLFLGTATSEDEIDTLISMENVVGPDPVQGGQNTLIGNEGKNRLVSLGGDTVMTGGDGADRFQQVLGGLEDPDRITDFRKGTDVMNFQEDALSVFSQTGEFDLIPLGRLSPELFALGTAGDENDFFIFESATGNLNIDPDGDGPVEPVTVTIIDNGAQIVAQDIVIVPNLFADELLPPFASPDPTEVSAGQLADTDLFFS